jgi:hypothetical protein
LCDEAKKEIAAARRRAEFEYREVDIDGDAEWVRLYNDEVPVIAIDGRKAFKYHVTAAALVEKLRRRGGSTFPDADERR